ncbi:MAG: hydantoinase B/oxoprolinase family protein [Alphaproteobacteria bacterium]|nr:hydantoinase B/oxoprolinase family protein [Alphaproteobacteria bacterium]
MSEERKMDMVAMSILDSTMVSVCREMGITLMKTSYSTIFNEALDFTCAIAAPNGDMYAVAEFCPAQIGGMPLVIQSSLQEIPLEDIEEGDVIVHNDPYRGGLHTPEHSLFTPVFVDGELIAFTVAIGHVAEVGGMAPGSFPAEASEIFHEGIRVPPVKIKKRGVDVAEVWKLWLANVRTPRHNYGDYRALISACELGARRVGDLVRKYGKDVYKRNCSDLMDYSEARMRAELAALKDGVYSFDDYMEDDGISDRPYRISVDVFIQGDEVIVDFARSDPQAQSTIKATLGVTWSASFNALLHLTDPTIPRNSGCFRPIQVLARPGTLVNVDYPAPEVGGNTETHPRIAYAVIGALAACAPERAFATDAATHCNFLFGGQDPRNDEYYVCYDFLCAGWGGRHFADGHDTVNCINGNCRTIPVEVFETRYPWLIESLCLAEDSGGPGKYRGGLGCTKTLRCIEGEITISHMGDRHKMRPWGLLGGGEADNASLLIRHAGAEDWRNVCELYGKVSPSKFGNVTLRLGDRIRLPTCGGGYGDVAERPREMIAEDVREGAQQAGFEALPVRIEIVEPMGANTLINFHIGETSVLARLDAYADEQPGEELTILIDMNRAVVVDPDSEAVI